MCSLESSVLDHSAFARNADLCEIFADPGAGMFSSPRPNDGCGRAHFLISESQAMPTMFRADRYSVSMSANPSRTRPSFEGFSCPGGQIPGAASVDGFSFLTNQRFLLDFRLRNIALWWPANSLGALTPPTR